MKNNFVKLVGNVCGQVKLLREKSEANNKCTKVEFIFIPNDQWDDEGKPNSLRIHAFGSLAEKILELVKSGDKLLLDCHLRRTVIPNCDESDLTMKYGVDIVVDKFNFAKNYYNKSKKNITNEVNVIVNN